MGTRDVAFTFQNSDVLRCGSAIAAFLRDRPVQRMVHVTYEELVDNPQAQLRRICETAGIDYRDDLVRYGEVAVEGAGLGDPIGVAQHDRPTTASVHKWTRNVAGDDVRTTLLQQMVARIDDAFGDSRAGTTVKPVLRF